MTDETGAGSEPTVNIERAGAVIGRYRLLRPIGEGGFGIVYEAEQTEPVLRRVALKIIKLGMDTRQVIARFEAERQALAVMDHPHIAKVLDAGATETGRPYFVMELVAGIPITEYCDRERLSTHARLGLFIETCNAVQHAHQKGIIHRDIKPSNVLVTILDGKPVPKVIDFGIAKATAIGGDQAGRTQITQLGQFIGTPEYMSPEQAAMTDLDIDTRTDVYSLGVLLYELLTGTTPFESTMLRRAGVAAIQRIIQEEDPPKPSTRVRLMSTTQVRAAARTPRDAKTVILEARSATDFSQTDSSLEAIARQRQTDPKSLCRALRGDLDWIIMKSLEKDRTRRYESVNGLGMDIRRHLDGEAVLAAPPSATYRMRKFIKRNRVMVSAGSLIAAALVLGIIGTTNQSIRATRAADKSERAAYQAQMVSAANAVEGQRIDAARGLLSATAPRLRGWEHQHLESRLDRTLPSPFPADWLITGCTTSADSHIVAVQRSVGGGPKEWVTLDRDLQTPRLVVPDTDMFSFKFSSDGRRALWAPPMPHHAGPAILWDVESAKVLATIPIDIDPKPDWSLVVTWSASGDGGGDRVMVSHPDGYQIHDGHTGARLRSATADGFMYFTGDERWMVFVANRQAVATNAGQLRLVDSRTFEPSADFYRFDSPINQISFRNSQIICALEDGTLRLLDIVDGAPRERTKIVAGITNFNYSAIWSPDGRMIAVGSAVSGRVRAWDADSGALVGDFSGPQSGVASQWFLPDASGLWACDAIGHHHVWPMSSGSPGVLTAHKGYVYPAVVSRDGSMLVTGGWDGLNGHSGGLKFWDARTGALVAEYGQPGELFRSADLTRDGRYVVTGLATPDEANHRTEVLDLTTGAVVTMFKPPSLYPVCTIVHPDGHRVISTYGRGNAYVWNLMTGKTVWQTDLLSEFSMRVPSTAAAVSPDGRTLAFTDRQLGIRLVNAHTYVDIRRWDAHTDGIWSLSFIPDGRWLLSASEDQTVGVWDVATGSLVTRLTGHGAQVLCAVMSPDGTRIASGGRDGIVRLWDTTHFENVAQLAGHGDYIYGLTWSPDGQQLISTSGDSTVRIWDTRTLAEQVAATKVRSEAVPRLEAKIAKARAESHDDQAAVETEIAAPELSARERELARQVAARFAFGGTPEYYRAPRTATPIEVDGRINEIEWKAAPWSDRFVDIEGNIKPKPRFETRMRMIWDDTNLYIAAHLEEPHVWGTLKNHDDIVFQDNDFEVFIDPEGDTHWYGEVEVNALGTIFDLRLAKPYTEGGPAHHDWSPPGIRAAVAIDGSLNDPSDVDRGWTVEIAIPYAALADHATVPMPPRADDVWRINFSRVQWQHDVVDGHYVKRPGLKEDNWVWTPQHVIDMHRPREWGFVEFAESPK